MQRDGLDPYRPFDRNCPLTVSDVPTVPFSSRVFWLDRLAVATKLFYSSTTSRVQCQLVRLEGFEPPTLGSVDRCSNPLSYSRVVTGPPC
jgi:hypothetical protein